MSSQNNIEALKHAMLERAQKLQDEHVAQGNASRQKIMQDVREKIHLMEEKELLAAKANAEKHFLRSVQSSEIKLQAELDKNRWGLVNTILNHLREQLQQLSQDEQHYKKVFFSLLEKAAEKMPADVLQVLVNETDYHRFSQTWTQSSRRISDKKLQLSEQTIACSGGFKLMTADGSILLDNSFEGMLERKQTTLQKLIFERLFATVDGKGALLNG